MKSRLSLITLCLSLAFSAATDVSDAGVRRQERISQRRAKRMAAKCCDTSCFTPITVVCPRFIMMYGPPHFYVCDTHRYDPDTQTCIEGPYLGTLYGSYTLSNGCYDQYCVNSLRSRTGNIELDQNWFGGYYSRPYDWRTEPHESLFAHPSYPNRPLPFDPPNPATSKLIQFNGCSVIHQNPIYARIAHVGVNPKRACEHANDLNSHPDYDRPYGHIGEDVTAHVGFQCAAPPPSETADTWDAKPLNVRGTIYIVSNPRAPDAQKFVVILAQLPE